MPYSLPETFDREDFLANYWQKKPVLLRQMFPSFHDPLSPEELAGLAMEPGVESKLVEGNDFKNWQVSHGPFKEAQFTSLPENDWTVLVQAVDQWHEEVLELKQRFDFLPSWRVDDVMVSFAAHGGSVGPHYDFYDVFLIQGLGERNWKLGKRCDSSTKTNNYSGLMILDEFEHEFDYTLKSGDVLYIPPQYSHWGSSNGRSLCYSVGFRAPSSAEILEGFSDSLIDVCLPESRFTDGQIELPLVEGEINGRDVKVSFRNTLKLVENERLYSIWFGNHATAVRYPGLIQAPESPYLLKDLAKEINASEGLCKNPSSRFAFLEIKALSEVLLFVDGQCIELHADQLWFAQWLCSDEKLLEDPTLAIHDPEVSETFLELLNQGSLVLF